MAGDHKFYYDFDSEIKLSSWMMLEKRGDTLKLRTSVKSPGGDYIFLAPADFAIFPTLTLLTVNGEAKTVSKRDAVYIDHEYARFGVEISLRDGENEIIATFLQKAECAVENIPLRLIKAEEAPVLPKMKTAIYGYPDIDYTASDSEFSSEGLSEGIGRRLSSGRFGFTKGDGLLDCAMPALGVVDKMFLSGQPKYKKPYRWSYSLLPEGMPLHASFEPKDVGIEDDDIKVNHLCVSWSAAFRNKKFTCTYSLASPAILTECDSGEMHLGLRYAGNYTSVLVPKQSGIVEYPLDEADISDMKENWMLLFNSTEFPDLPLMLVFDRNPESMSISRDKKGRLLSVDFSGVPLMYSLTPFGIERFDPFKMPVSDAIRRAEFWSRAVLAYPVDHREYFSLDEARETVTVRQKFEYRIVSDQWGTIPLKLAPLPPPLTVCKTADIKDARNLEFPTKYGQLYGRLSSWSEYTIPMMPLDRRFPIPKEKSGICELLSADMEEFRAFSSEFNTDLVSYPYAGAHLEAFAFPSSMSLYMKESDREYFKEKLKERLSVALDRDRVSDYIILDWGVMMAENPAHDRVKEIYSDKTRKRMPLSNFHTRIEPFTGANFDICYLNVSYISKGAIKTGTNEEILNLKIPLIENDWGVGLTFYYMYLASLAVGSFEEVRRHWELIKKVYSFFERMHDFACMGTGYSDNAITWVEGANYGVFTSFIKMAEAVGDEEARAFGIYNAAKQFALRLAIMRSSVEYFPEYFEVAPWYCAKHFHEELAPSFAFQNYPNLYFEDLRRDGVYNFTTEGLYPEAYSGLRKYGGDVYDTVMNKLSYALTHGLENPGFHWGIIQQYTGMLIDMANNYEASESDFYRLVEYGRSHSLIVPEWRGIHIFSRALPKNYFLSQILSWQETKSHKVYLISWEETEITSAVYTDDRAQIDFKYSGFSRMRIILGITEQPKEIRLNGERIEFVQTKVDKIQLYPQFDGKIEIIF